MFRDKVQYKFTIPEHKQRRPSLELSVKYIVFKYLST